MKHIFLILAFIGLTLASCKKEKPIEPTPPQAIVTPPTPTDTTGNGTGNGTGADTVGKVKIFYSLKLGSVNITTGRDYKLDTTNVRIYHNGTQLRNHFIDKSVDGLQAIENGQTNYVHAETPLWCNHGDSIVMVFDSLEINGTTSAQSERFTRIVTKIRKDASGTSGTLISQLDSYQYGTYNYILNPYYTATTNTWHVLGTKINPTSGLNETWVIGGKFKLVYVIP